MVFDLNVFKELFHNMMKNILWALFFFVNNIFAEEFILLCKGQEVKYAQSESYSEMVGTKVIGIQIYPEGMRLDGEWFDSKNDITDDYSLKRSYLKTKENISGTRNFSTNSLTKGRKIKTVKTDKVEINMLTNEINWASKFNRVDITDVEQTIIYAFRKDFKGICK